MNLSRVLNPQKPVSIVIVLNVSIETLNTISRGTNHF